MRSLIEFVFQFAPFIGRSKKEVAYYMSMEQSPFGGLRLSPKQWYDVMRTGDVGDNESHPVPPEVQKEAINWMLSVDAALSLHEETKTVVQDIIDARMGWGEGEKQDSEKYFKKDDKKESKKESKKEGKKKSTSRWEEQPLSSIDLAMMELD